MQNEKGLGTIRVKTRLVGPRKNGRLMRRAPNFKYAGKLCPNCTLKLYRTENGKKISYFKFPDDVNLKKRWLHAICCDECKDFTVNQNTKICSRHFKPEDFVKSIGGQHIYVRKGVGCHVFLGHKVLR